ncbi:MAG: 16S rRNA (cytosine(1402)-N(4))-methyltransferase RsmH [Bacteroidota bacterium]|jgi:16S rRNA (cytosine1402-N4)-methyltransferase
MSYHEPVMLRECLDALQCKKDGVYVDATFGGGGHSKAILNALGENGRLLAFDRDEDALANTINDSRFTLIRDNFSHMEQQLGQIGIHQVDGILADLGVSSHQFDVAQRGFSIRFEHDLDMRMDNRESLTALEILNTYSEKELVSIFSLYGEVRNSKSLAAAIVKKRAEQQLTGSADLRNCIKHLMPAKDGNTWLAQIYQALRIEINNELDSLRALLDQSKKLVKSGGRIAIMSYHSLEDRMVKNMINTGNVDGEDHRDLYGNKVGMSFHSIARKAIIPSQEEIEKNPRSRSAKLRVAEKI